MLTPAPSPAKPATQPAGQPAAPRRQLTLFDSTCIIVGIIIGAGIYRSGPAIAGFMPEAGQLLELRLPGFGLLGTLWLSPMACLIALWLAGGLLALIGALCYAELVTAYPESGGDYVFLTRAYGRSAGFIFAWAELWVIRPGSVGGIAYVFAEYANELWPLAIGERAYLAVMGYAAAAVAVLTLVNIIGVREGKWTQNLLTTVKVLGLLLIVIAAFAFGSPAAGPAAAATSPGPGNFRLALIFILWTYGGWNEMSYVGAEIHNPRRNILRALVLGTLAVTAVYLLVNLAFVYALSFEGFRDSPAAAADVLRLGIGDWGARLVSLLICISALGAINGQIFTGARIYYAMGRDHKLYARLGRWHPRMGTPVASLILQITVTLGLIAAFGMLRSGFESMVEFTAAIYWTFALLVGLSLFVLRRRDRQVERPYRVPLYPLPPILFCASCLFMLYSSLSYAFAAARYEPVWAVALVAIGVVAVFFNPPREEADRDQTGQPSVARDEAL